ncbi:MAG: ATP-binding protein [Lachnospiraceae bacterium]|nr:ATP-binding protein [Lachnospiraceae bacterium]
MMTENQNVEWKESWRDEYLKWICGFANAQGGKIYIGTNDDGTVVGIKNSKKLMEDIPNKIQTTMGIIADVNLLSENNKEYIEIVVSPSSYPVSYKGEYHYRSGSTKQQLKGAALTEFLVSKTGFKWDAIPVDDINVDDLDNESFKIFRREAIRSGRMLQEDLEMSNAELLDSLNLVINGKLKRAAVMLFYPKPERLITGSFVKIGKFGEGADLQYQDEVRGSLILIADRVVELIYLKYLKATITYDKETRIETYPFPRDAIREAVYNALIHCNWADSIPIQIRIEDDAMYISNACILPSEWTVEKLKQRHKSRPYNPDIANTFFRAGYVETWGRGIQKICEACKRHGIPEPEFEVLGGDITVKFTALQMTKNLNRQNGGLDGGLDGGLADRIIDILKANSKITQKNLALEINVPLRTIQRTLKRLQDQGYIERKGGKRYGYWEVYK